MIHQTNIGMKYDSKAMRLLSFHSSHLLVIEASGPSRAAARNKEGGEIDARKQLGPPGSTAITAAPKPRSVRLRSTGPDWENRLSAASWKNLL
jgi:hypothetical protein